MALAVNRTGTVFKKCDRSNHKPDSNKNCAAGTCQHSCQPAEGVHAKDVDDVISDAAPRHNRAARRPVS